ncbi:MAG TPA: HPr family phosphocarrier protein [Candidatus Acidoferrales bacterium]|nr:HPr family phosphocarrier protein [Candidatus Acidoferrales bacterium]
MQEIELEVRNPSGLHARPASMFVKAAAGFRSRVRIENLTRGTKPGDAKSILTMLTAGVKQGHLVRITAEGDDESAAIASLADLVRSGMGEPVE